MCFSKVELNNVKVWRFGGQDEDPNSWTQKDELKDAAFIVCSKNERQTKPKQETRTLVNTALGVGELRYIAHGWYNITVKGEHRA